LYLRSNGYEEYRNIIGKRYVWIYDIMFRYVVKHSEIITCHKRLYVNKCHILYPSELNLKWKKGLKKNYFKNNTINLLYVGRFKIEKGLYSLLNIFSKLEKNIKLTLVGSGDPIEVTDNRIKIIDFVVNEKKLIKLYDSANIIILPSYTEAHPKVIDEALSRIRPVIIFNDIKYVINNRKGVFSIQRDAVQLNTVVNFIKKNIKKISVELKKNKLPSREVFLKDLFRILSDTKRFII
jgi:glycosyltransferase involved in cell wall biosynthesis